MVVTSKQEDVQKVWNRKNRDVKIRMVKFQRRETVVTGAIKCQNGVIEVEGQLKMKIVQKL